MQAKVNTLLFVLLGWSFVVLGIIGLFVPVVQGVLFLLIGLFVLSSKYSWARRLLHQLRRRFPSLARRSDEAAWRPTTRWRDCLDGSQAQYAGRRRMRVKQPCTFMSPRSNRLVRPVLGARGRETLQATRVRSPDSSVAKDPQ
jgi:hypothetical protein